MHRASDAFNCVSGLAVMSLPRTKKGLFHIGLVCALLSRWVLSDSWQPRGLQPARLPCPWGFSKQECSSALPLPLPGDLPDPGIEPRCPALQADSLPSEPPARTKNTGVGNLSLLQGIFPTQESNWGLLHCRQILYQLSYQGSSNLVYMFVKV